jgi:hypothetical protein
VSLKRRFLAAKYSLLCHSTEPFFGCETKKATTPITTIASKPMMMRFRTIQAYRD